MRMRGSESSLPASRTESDGGRPSAGAKAIYSKESGPMNHTHGPAKTADELRAAILERYDGLSKRLQQVARHILDQPHEVGIDTLAELAARSDTQPSTIVRFAKYFGFDGASSMQRLFRDALVSNHK